MEDLVLGRHDPARPLGCSGWYRARNRGGARLRGRGGAAAKRPPVAVRDGDRCRASGVGGAQGSVMKMLAIMFAAALLVAGCGGGKGGATAGNPSNNTSVCAYTKRVASRGRVYIEMAATPSSEEPMACSAFNGDFGGRRIPPVGRMGTGHVYCRYSKSGWSSTIKFGVFASSRTTGLAFCRSFHPGHGFRRDG